MPAALIAQTNCASVPPGLVGWWAAEGNANDGTGTNNGSLQGGATFGQGEVGQAFSFNGTNAYVAFPASPSLNVGGGDGLTIECWIKPGDLSTGHDIAEWNNGAGGIGSQLHISIPDYGGLGSVFVNLLDIYGADHFLSSRANLLNVSNFQHVAVTYDKGSGTARIYYNGAVVTTQNLGSFTPQTTYSLYLGTRFSGNGAGEFYKGLLDEVSLYNRALLATEIASIYNAGSAGKCTGPTPPSILIQPTNQTVTAGGSVSFATLAAGTAPLTYQWRKDGTNISGALNSSYTIISAQTNNAGAYSVLVSNLYGGVTSSNAILTVNPAPPCAPVLSGLVGWWAAEGSANDNTGTNNGSLQGGATFGPGEVGQAFSFNGTSAYVALPASPSLNVGAGNGLTIECWMKPGDLSTGHAIAEWNNGAGGIGAQFQISVPNYGGLGSAFVNLLDINGADHFISSGANLLNLNNFQHVAVTYDKASGTARIYYNGGVVATQNLGSFTPQTTYSLYLGTRFSGNGAGAFYKGLLDEVSLYNRALSATEIAAIYNADSAGKCTGVTLPSILIQPTNQTVTAGGSVSFATLAAGTAPLTYQWRKDGTNISGALNSSYTIIGVQTSNAGAYSVLVSNLYGGVTSSNAVLTVNPAPPCAPVLSGLVGWWAAEGSANDNTGTNNGSLQGGATFGPGEVGQAFSFNGTSAYVALPASPSLNVGAGNGLTIECWMKPGDLSTEHAIAEWNNGAGGIGSQFQISVPNYGGVGSVFVNLLDINGADHFISSGVNLLNLNNFQHVAVTYDKASGTARIYYNGAVVATQNLGSFTPQTTYSLYLGTRFSGNGAGAFYKGLLDEVSLYNRALSATEIAAIYDADSAGKCTGPTPPSILIQPTDQIVTAGGSVNFATLAAGTAPLTYQWRKDGTNISGALNSSYTIIGAHTSNAGAYSVVVSNFYGGVTSSNAILTVNPAPPCAPVLSGLVGWWAAEGSANDNTGTNNGSLQGGATFGPGEVGQAFSFNGTSAYVALPASPSLNVGAGNGLTIECWMKPGDLTTGHDIAEWNNGAGGIGSQLHISIPDYGGLGSVFVNLLDINGADHFISSGANLLNVSNFQHVAVTYDQGSGTARIYYNGAVVATQNLGSFTPQTTYSLYLGTRFSGNGAGEFYMGLLDEVSLYNRALNDAELQAIYNAGTAGKCLGPPANCIPAPPQIVSWWPGEGAGNDVVDGNSGTLYGGVTFTNGINGQAFRFNGSTGHIRVADKPNLHFTDALTVEAWVNPGTLGLSQGIIEKWGGNQKSFSFALSASNQVYLLVSGNGTDSGSVFAQSSNAIPVSQWTHVAGTYNGFVVRVYVNGQLKGEIPYSQGIFLGTNDLGIGGVVDGPAPQVLVPFSGSIDEPSIYNRSLTAAEIQDIFAAGAAGKCPLSNPTNCVPPASGIAAWWQAEGNANDVVGSNNSILIGTSFALGQVGAAFNFDGLGNSVSNAVGAITNIRDSYTMEFWAYPTAARNVSAESTNAINGTVNQRYAIFPNFGGAAGPAGAGISVGTNGVSVFEHGEGYLSSLLVHTGAISGWTHVAVVYSNRQPSLYLNGTLVRVGLTSAWSSSPSTILGGRIWVGNNYGFYAGLLDEVSIYNRPLAASEVQAIYAADGAGKCGPGRGPVILAQPQNQTVSAGGTAVFTVSATGTTPLNFQWKFNGSNILAATGSSLTLNNVQSGQAGYYSVLVGNPFGSALSSTGLLAVLPISTNCAPPANGIVAWWPGEGNANEIVGANNGILVGGVGFGLGEVGQAFNFDGTSGSVSNAVPALLAIRDSYTIEFWASPTSGRVLTPEGTNGITGTSGQRYAVFPNFGGTAGPAGAGVSVGTNGVSIFEHADNYLASPLVYTGALSGWTHVAVVYSNRQPSLYLNGSLVRIGLTSSWSSSPSTILGGRIWAGLNYGFYAGLLDEVSIYNRALAGSEVQAIFAADGAGKCRVSGPPTNCVTPPSGLVSWWKGDGNTLDLRSGNNGTFYGNAGFGPGRVGQGFVFDGQGDGVRIGNPPNLQLQDFTIETWIKRASTSAVSADGNGNGTIFGYGPPGGYGFYLAPGGYPALTRAGIDNVTLSTAITDTNFHHLAVTKAGTNVVFYIDSIFQQSFSYNPGFTFTTSAAIGGVADSQNYTFLGTIDEVSFYNRALSASEVQSIYNADGAGKCPVPVAPTISTQPASQTVVVGGAATFNVVAFGTPPLSYQWQSNGTNIPGQTQTSLSLVNIQPTNGGLYRVLVSNVVATVPSSNALLTVNPAPPCFVPPFGMVSWWKGEGNAQDQTGGNNGTLYGNATFGAARVGQGFVFDGFGDGVQLGNPTNLQTQDFTIETWIKRASTSAVSGDGNGNGTIFGYGVGGYGIYLAPGGNPALTKVGVNNVTMSKAITDTNFHHLAVTKAGGTVTFYVDGISNQVFSYNPGFTFTTSAGIGGIADLQNYTFLGTIDEVSFYNRALSAAEVQGIYNADGAGKCTGGSGVPPSIITQPRGITVNPGATVLFSVNATGTPPLAYQWSFNGTNIASATGSALVLSNVQPAQAGNYAVNITNLFGSTNSSNALLTVLPVSTNCVPPPPGIVAWWPAEGNGNDIVGGNNGVVIGTSFTPGEVSQAFSFDGVGNSISNATPALTNILDSYTMEFWAWPTASRASSAEATAGLTGTSGQRYAIFPNFGGTGPVGPAGAGVSVGTNGVSVFEHGDTYLPALLVYDAPIIGWTHIAVVYSNRQPSLYLNGALVRTGLRSTWSSCPSTILGGRIWNGLNYGFYAGLLDEVSIYNRPLSPGEVQAIFAADGLGKCRTSPPPTNCVPPAPGLVSWWPAEGNANDSIDGNSGTLYGGATFTSGEVGQSFSFNGSTAHVRIADRPNLHVSTGLTLEAWINPSALGNSQGLIEKWGGNQKSFSFAIQPGNNHLYLLVSGTGTDTGSFFAESTNAILANQWTHVAGTYDGSRIRVYINGFLQGQISFNQPIFAGTNDLGIGGVVEGSPPQVLAPFAGRIDEPSIYNRALSDGEIQAIYLAGGFGKCQVPVGPSISLQPQSQTVTVGSNATFNVVAGGATPLYYQWKFNGTNISGASASSYTVLNAQLANAGAYSVLVSNAINSVLSSNAILTVNPGPTILEVANATVSSGGTVTLPVLLTANGSENALSFSINWPTSRLSYVSATLANASGATTFINENQTNQGRFGLALALPTGATFPAGQQTLVELTLTAAVVSNATLVPINFGDQPIVRQVVDVGGNILPANYLAGSVSITPPSYEADVSPRPNGDQAVTVSDWVIIGRFAAHLETPANGSEFQRADCAPRANLGDGRISVMDWVQAGRYAAGLDPLTIAGGPTSQVAHITVKNSGARPLNTRQMQVGNAVLFNGLTGTLSINLKAVGNENAAGFSLAFNPTNLTYVGASLGNSANGATLLANTAAPASGRVGFVIGLPSGSRFAAGVDELLKVTFRASSTVTGSSVVTMGDDPVEREISDSAASALISDYFNGTVTVNPLPSLRIARTGQSIQLAWPSWATNFVLQQSDGNAGSLTWTTMVIPIGTTNNESLVTVPNENNTRFYRLLKQ